MTHSLQVVCIEEAPTDGAASRLPSPGASAPAGAHPSTMLTDAANDPGPERDDAIDTMVAAARRAQRAFEAWSEERVDALLRDVAEAVAREAELLAEATVVETGFGLARDKVAKILAASRGLFATLEGERAFGPLGGSERSGVVEIACPMGVVFGLVPVTNPVPTLVFKALIALKGRNALIISCQRRALSVGSRALGLIQEVLREHGAPEGLVQGLARRVGRKTTQELMQHEGVDFILATGGPGMVRAAHSSGTPAIGVGPGNAPAWICPGADLDRAARSVIASKSFDHGIICAAESNLVVDERVLPAFLDALELHGAAVLTSDEAARLRDLALHPSRGSLRLSVLGRSAESIALSAGIHREHPIRVLVLPLGRDQLRSTWAAEKLAPILSLFRVEGEDDGLVVCKELLDHYGKGHTAVIHSPDRALATRFACQVPASRVLVNVPAVQGTLGLCTDLVPSMTLGCGTMGGSSTTDSVGFRNLLNIKRLAFPSPSP